MRSIKLNTDEISLSDEVECFYETIVTPFGTSGKVGVPKRYLRRRAYVIVLKK